MFDLKVTFSFHATGSIGTPTLLFLSDPVPCRLSSSLTVVPQSSSVPPRLM